MHRRFRLRQARDFERLRRHGRRYQHPFVVLVVVANEERVSRFGFTASRRVGNAVKRNRAKRLLREAVRLHIDNVQSGYDCLFIAKLATSRVSYLEIEAAILQLLESAGVLKINREPESRVFTVSKGFA
jgi:ribonuclease P protein component